MDRLPLVNLQLEGIKASAQRGRVAFFIAILSACAVTVTLYNEHFAWSRRLLDDAWGFTQRSPRWTAARPPISASTSTPASPAHGSADDLAMERRIETIKNWEDDTYIKLDLLGIRLGAADLTFFGSLAMLVVSIYYCLCARRTYYDIRSVVVEVSDSKDVQLQQYVLDGIRQSLVLTVSGERESALVDPLSTSSTRLLRLVTSVISLLTYSPAIAIAAILYGDIRFAFFRDDVPSWTWVLQNLQQEYLIQFVALDLLALALIVFVWYLNRLTSRFQRAAGTAVSKLADTMSELQQQAVAAGH